MKLFKICFLMAASLHNVLLYAEQYEYTGNCQKLVKYARDFERCLDKELAEYNKELNNLYSKGMPDNKLKRVELLWIKFKEADCEYIASEVNQGLYYQFIYKSCLINKTKARITDLQRSYFYSGWFNKKA